MSISTAKDVAKFIENNDVEELNLMGGEFFCNPDWYEIFCILIPPAKKVRIVTNGDWAGNMTVKIKLASIASLFGHKIFMSISKDKWHTNKYVNQADSYLSEIGIIHNVAKEDEVKDVSIVPVGRSELDLTSMLYSFVACYCHAPKNMYSFLIDEDGNIYKCGFGVFKYANVSTYIDGGFKARFKDFNKRFYDVFISSCSSCIKSLRMFGHQDYIVRND